MFSFMNMNITMHICIHAPTDSTKTMAMVHDNEMSMFLKTLYLSPFKWLYWDKPLAVRERKNSIGQCMN